MYRSRMAGTVLAKSVPICRIDAKTTVTYPNSKRWPELPLNQLCSPWYVLSTKKPMPLSEMWNTCARPSIACKDDTKIRCSILSVYLNLVLFFVSFVFFGPYDERACSSNTSSFEGDWQKKCDLQRTTQSYLPLSFDRAAIYLLLLFNFVIMMLCCLTIFYVNFVLLSCSSPIALALTLFLSLWLRLQISSFDERKMNEQRKMCLLFLQGPTTQRTNIIEYRMLVRCVDLLWSVWNFECIHALRREWEVATYLITIVFRVIVRRHSLSIVCVSLRFLKNKCHANRFGKTATHKIQAKANSMRCLNHHDLGTMPVTLITVYAMHEGVNTHANTFHAILGNQFSEQAAPLSTNYSVRQFWVAAAQWTELSEWKPTLADVLRWNAIQLRTDNPT